MHTVKPTLYSMLVRVNDQPQSLLSGEKLTIHPKDRIRILKVSTNVPFNIGIRLYSKMFDAQSLVYDEMRVIDLLPEGVAFTNPTLKVHVKYYNQEAGYVVFLVRPFVGDWLEKASRIIDRKKRIALLQQAMVKVPGSVEIRQRLLKEYLAAREYEKASKLLEEEAQKSASEDVLRQLLQIYRKASNTKGVISTLERLISLNPADKQSRYELAEVLQKRGWLPRAISQYRAILKLAAPDEKFDLYVQLGYLSAKAGKISEAIRYYKEALKLHGGDQNLYYNLSYLYDKVGKRDKADFYLEKALRLKKSDIEGRLRLAQDCIEKGRFKKAKSLLNEVLKKRPKSLKALLLLMEVAEKSGDKTGIRSVYKRILRVQPKNTTVLYNLGVLEYEAGRFKSASNYLEKYVAIKPKDKTAQSLLLDIYKQTKQTKKGLKKAQELLNLGVKDPELYAYLFDTFKAAKAYGKIESVMKKAIRGDPKNAQLHKYLLFAYLQEGEEGKAMAEMENVLKLEPNNIELWMHLAMLREENKKYGEAMAAYKKVLELDPNNEQAADAYLKLRLRGFEEKVGQ